MGFSHLSGQRCLDYGYTREPQNLSRSLFYISVLVCSELDDSVVTALSTYASGSRWLLTSFNGDTERKGVLSHEY